MRLKNKFRDWDLNKFEDLYGRFLSLGTRLTQPNKFRYLNNRFVSLRTVMTHPNKFRDWWWTLLSIYINICMVGFSVRTLALCCLRAARWLVTIQGALSVYTGPVGFGFLRLRLWLRLPTNNCISLTYMIHVFIWFMFNRLSYSKNFNKYYLFFITYFIVKYIFIIVYLFYYLHNCQRNVFICGIERVYNTSWHAICTGVTVNGGS